MTKTAAGLAWRYLAARGRRAAIAPDLFSDRAWDMLLDLFGPEAKGRAISVSSACLASGAPMTTALDRLRRLETGGLGVRSCDPADRRRTFVRISTGALKQMERWLVSTFGV